jgi:hypothetical protein
MFPLLLGVKKDVNPKFFGYLTSVMSTFIASQLHNWMLQTEVMNSAPAQSQIRTRQEEQRKDAGISMDGERINSLFETVVQ